MQTSQNPVQQNPTAKTNILVVDDEPLLRDAISRQLAREGYTLHTATNGTEAYNFLQSNQIQLIISDIRMPNGDGIELLRNVKKNFCKIPFLLMTGYSDTPPQEAYHLGAEAILKKPFNFDDFIGTVHTALSPYSFRWPQIDLMPASIDINIEFKDSLEETLNSGDLLVGKGGFCISADQILFKNGKNISFSISFQSGTPSNLCGFGTLRWNYSQLAKVENRYIGIEITKLVPESHTIWIDLYERDKPTSYIPLQNYKDSSA